MDWLTSRLNIVRVRQIIDDIRHGLLFIPLAYVGLGAIISQSVLLVDRQLSTTEIPDVLATTVPAARTVLAAIAGGLITSITLLMSIALVAVQLASSQFSPRTLRNWLGNRVLQNTIGLALGTTVFCLLGLRSARTFDGSDAIVPHFTVLVGLGLGIASLIAVVRSVDHVTRSLQVGAVAASLVQETVGVIESAESVRASAAPLLRDHPRSSGGWRDSGHGDVDETAAFLVRAPRSGFVQQIDNERLIKVMPEDSIVRVATRLGSFVMKGAPLVWLSPTPPEDHPCRTELAGAFAIGNSRTMQQDVGFGLAQLTDIAVRALSPGINDPRTAMEIVMEIGEVLRKIWAYPPAPRVERDGSRTIIRAEPEHEDYLRAALGPIFRYGRSDPDVVVTMLDSLSALLDEVERNDLPGPTEPIRAMAHDIAVSADSALWTGFENDAAAAAAPAAGAS